MKKYTGKGVNGAIAMGKVFLCKKEETAVMPERAEDVSLEKERVAAARAMALEQLREIRGRALREAGEADAGIFEAHMLLLEDVSYNDFIDNILESRHMKAEYAVAETADHFGEMFASMEDPCLKARAADLRDVSDRLIANLRGERAGGREPEEQVILCARDLSPSETVSLDREKILAFVTARGAVNSHTAILARGMDIPAVVGVGDLFLEETPEGSRAIVDGSTGEVIIDPDEETYSAYAQKRRAEEEKRQLLQGLKGRENVTLDGRRVRICANIGDVREVDAAFRSDAGGIGLFRSEFLYLESSDYPTEEQQFSVYRKVLEGMPGKKVIIRTLDIGGDKQADYFGLKKEENPALGYRGIRICLTRPEIFKTQLRALYRASVYGNMGILFPMIVSAAELEKTLEICREVREELDVRGVSYSHDVELGIMIETPAAALISDRLAPMVDFFSVGTNDLTQYTLACDRQNPDVEPFVDPHHEAVLRLIGMSADNAHRHGAWIGICGELAADTSLTETFLRMGIDELSVSPASVLELREKVRSLDLSV